MLRRRYVGMTTREDCWVQLLYWLGFHKRAEAFLDKKCACRFCIERVVQWYTKGILLEKPTNHELPLILDSGLPFVLD